MIVARFCEILFLMYLIIDEICGYTVYKPNSVPIPFQVILKDRKTGSAKIVLAKGSELNYESTKSYEFEIAADDCVTGAHSVRFVCTFHDCLITCQYVE